MIPTSVGISARLNLAAGIQAQSSSAYEAALGYLRTGQELLPEDPWTADYDLTMALATEYQQCAYLTARYDEAETWIEQILTSARTNLEKAETLSVRTRQYATIEKMERTINTDIMSLSLFGMLITKNPKRPALADAAVSAIWREGTSPI
jgi:predicted ATPase